MSPRAWRERIRDILDAVAEITTFTQGMVVSLDSVDEHEQARSEDARSTLLLHDTRFASGERLWRSPHATVLTHHAPMTANAALARLWSVVEPIAAFHDGCAPCVRARFRCARARRTSVYAWRNRMTRARCGPWQKGMLCEVPAVSSRSTRRPSVTEAIEPDGLVRLSPPPCLTPGISLSAKETHDGASCVRKKRLCAWPSRGWHSRAM